MSRRHLFIVIAGVLLLSNNLLAQQESPDAIHPPIFSPYYAASPSHREIALKALDLALLVGVFDTTGITIQEVRDRIEAGAYSEDFEAIPGTTGEHYPAPWNQGPQLSFGGVYPPVRIPYGALNDTSSGWYRGLPHGYDPVHGYIWPGTSYTTIGWADAAVNNFSWSSALALYRQGKKGEAYECLGHILHLLSDLSVPEHVKVVDHGTRLTTENQGTFSSPDIATFVLDEYELALAGGVAISGVGTLIPDRSVAFAGALNAADTAKIPLYSTWQEYLEHMALITYNDSLVNVFFAGPSAGGEWGSYKDDSGHVVAPAQLGTTPPAQIEGRWTQVVLKSTASTSTGTILPVAAIDSLSQKLVKTSVEYCAGLILRFVQESGTPLGVAEIKTAPAEFQIGQNYPNPFNPSTEIRYALPVRSHVRLDIFNMLGEEVAHLVDNDQDPGYHFVQWDAHGMASGTYFYRLSAGQFIGYKKLALLK